MDYSVKAVIGGIEMLETADIVERQEDGVTYEAPSISAITLRDNATNGTMEIGATPSDCLTLTINNPNRQNYDGETVELWIAAPEDETDDMTEMSEIEDEVGEDTEVEGIDDEDDSDELDDEDDSEGEDATAEDLEDVETATTITIESQYIAFEGEDVSDPDEDTDEAEEAEWVRTGIFYVQKQVNSDDRKAVILTCYDAMQKLNADYLPANRTATIQALFDDLRTQALNNREVVIDAFDYGADGTRTVTMPFPISYREALGYFAGLIGGYATCGDDGSIGFSLYGFSDGLYLDTALNYLNIDAAGDIELDGIQCDKGLLQEELLTSGIDPDITFKNPFMTQDILDGIMAEYKSIRFCGGTFKMGWDDSITAGSFIRIMSPEEYENYIGLQNALEAGDLTDEEILDVKENTNELGTVFLVSSQLIDFTGEATTTVTSICESATQNDNKMTSPADAKFNRVSAKVVETEQLIAQKADIEDLHAQNAVFAKVLAENVTVTELTGTKANFGTLLAESFTADQITALQAIFDQVTTGGLSAENITSVTGQFEQLAASSFTAEQVSAASAAFSKATIGALTVKRLETEYANIDFANVTTESVKNLFVNVGMLENAVIREGQITGTLAGVHVVADVIEANTIVAGDFVVQGSDENWYRINPAESGITQEQLEELNAYEKYVSGEYIVAKSITADQIAVSDLYAFGATIAGLQLENGSIHSIGKTSVSSNVAGMYIDSTGQFNTGDATNFIASWYDATEQKWKVAIRADQITFGSGEDVQAVVTGVKEIAENTLIYDHTYSISNGVATFTPHVYQKGVEVTSNYAASCFKWYYRTIDGSEVQITTASDRTCTVTISQRGYGGHVIGTFTPA